MQLLRVAPWMRRLLADLPSHGSRAAGQLTQEKSLTGVLEDCFKSHGISGTQFLRPGSPEYASVSNRFNVDRIGVLFAQLEWLRKVSSLAPRQSHPLAVKK